MARAQQARVDDAASVAEQAEQVLTLPNPNPNSNPNPNQVLLGLGEYETHNALDNHTDLLLGGLVTNESLYLSLAD